MAVFNYKLWQNEAAGAHVTFNCHCLENGCLIQLNACCPDPSLLYLLALYHKVEGQRCREGMKKKERSLSPNSLIRHYGLCHVSNKYSNQLQECFISVTSHTTYKMRSLLIDGNYSVYKAPHWEIIGVSCNKYFCTHDFSCKFRAVLACRVSCYKQKLSTLNGS